MNINDKIKEIWEAKINVKIDLKNIEAVFLDDVEFDQNSNDSIYRESRGLYSWSAHYDNWRNVFPMKDANYVKEFKTLNGAKRNFIKSYLKGNI